MFSDSFGIGGHVITFTIPVSVCNVKVAVIVSVVTVHGVQLCKLAEYLGLMLGLMTGSWLVEHQMVVCSAFSLLSFLQPWRTSQDTWYERLAWMASSLLHPCLASLSAISLISIFLWLGTQVMW